MNEREFHEKADKVFLKIEEWIESLDEDIEIESFEGMLTLTSHGAGQVVLSRQAALNEIWLASKLGAFHFKYMEGDWVTQQGKMLTEVLSQLFKQPINEVVNLKDGD